MKKYSVPFALLALTLVLGLVFVSCDNGMMDGDGVGSGNTSRVQGTYYVGLASWRFRGSNYSGYLLEQLMERGNFTVSGNTVTLTVTSVYKYNDREVGDKSFLTIIDENTLRTNDTGELLIKK